MMAASITALVHTTVGLVDTMLEEVSFNHRKFFWHCPNSIFLALCGWLNIPFTAFPTRPILQKKNLPGKGFVSDILSKIVSMTFYKDDKIAIGIATVDQLL